MLVRRTRSRIPSGNEIPWKFKRITMGEVNAVRTRSLIHQVAQLLAYVTRGELAR